MMTEELKPCPFCGNEAHIYETSHDSDSQVQVQCKGCGAEIAFWLPWTASSGQKVAAYADVERRWNRRADLAAEIIALRARVAAADALAEACRSLKAAMDTVSPFTGHPSYGDVQAASHTVVKALAAWEAAK